jgi:hypothetical protein
MAIQTTEKLTFQEIIDRLKAEQIRFSDIVRHDDRRPEWLGPIEVQYGHSKQNPRTKDEWANDSSILYLPAHELYVKASGVKDGGESGNRKWRYELTLVERKTKEVPARAAYTKVSFDTIYPCQTTGYPDPSQEFPSYYAKQDAAESTKQMVQITTYEFEKGLLHLERGAITLEEVVEMYGPVLKSWDAEMPAQQFFSLPDFGDI